MDRRPRVGDCRTPSPQGAGWMLGGEMQPIWLGICRPSLSNIRKQSETPETVG